MSDRVLADGYLSDLATRSGGPFADARAMLQRVGVILVVVALPAGICALATEGSIYVEDIAWAVLGVAQALLLRAGVGHRDADVTALAGELISDAQDR